MLFLLEKEPVGEGGGNTIFLWDSGAGGQGEGEDGDDLARYEFLRFNRFLSREGFIPRGSAYEAV